MKPTLVVNPVNDEVFADFAALLVEQRAMSTDDLERRLRKVYPNATVHRRQLSGERALIWYIYREGSWISSRRTSIVGVVEDDGVPTRRRSQGDR